MIVAKRSKEEREEERKKELLRTLRRGPDLDRFIDEKKRNFVSYAQGARMYSMNYYSFVKLAKEAEWAVGLLTLIVGAAIIYSVVIHRWGDLFLYSLIFAGIMVILMAVVVVQDFCSSMIEKISML